MAFTVAAMRQQTAGQPLAPPAPEFRNLLPVSMTASLGRPDNASPARWRGVEAAVGASADAAHAALIGVQDVGKEAIERVGGLLRKLKKADAPPAHPAHRKAGITPNAATNLDHWPCETLLPDPSEFIFCSGSTIRRNTNLTPFAECIEDGTAISLMTYGEIYEGIIWGRRWEALEIAFLELLRWTKVLPLDEEIMRRFAGIRGGLRRSGQIIGDPDIMVAATALHHNLTLVTRNLDHFRRVPDLRIYETG